MLRERLMANVTLLPGRIELIRLLMVLSLVICGIAMGKNATDAEIELLLNKLNKPAVRTIQSRNGDIIDCVDIYKQPAFDHPLLMNYKIKMRPSFIPRIGRSNFSKYNNQVFQESVSCPKGTIPILRVTKSDLLREGFLESFGMVHPDVPPEVVRTEHAGAFMINAGQLGPLLTGVAGEVSVWHPRVEPADYSMATVMAIGPNNFDQVLAGWSVNVLVYGNSEPHFTIRWIGRAGNVVAGCINLRCPGFVQTTRHIILGGLLRSSTYGHDPLFMTHISIHRDARQRVWWLMVDAFVVGFWPFRLFQGFDHARSVMWSGIISNMAHGGRHTSTQMGSGHFANEGWSKAAHFGNLQFMGSNNDNFRSANRLQTIITYPHCYNLVQGADDPHGPKIFYGGPGGDNCHLS